MFGITGDPVKEDFIKIQEYLKSNPDFVLTAFIEDKKLGFRVIQIKPDSWRTVREAVRLNAIVCEANTFAYLYKKVNFGDMGANMPKIVKYLKSTYVGYIIASKLGWLSNPRTWTNNAVDNGLKMVAETGASIPDVLKYNAMAAADITQYNKACQEIFKIIDRPGITSWDEAVSLLFKEPPRGIKLNEYNFRHLHNQLQSYVFPGESWAWTARQAAKDVKTNPAVKTARMMATLGFSPISITENVARLAHLKYLEDTGVGLSEAMARTVKTYFDYAGGFKGAQNLLFPFYNFMVSNLTFWLEVFEKHPRFLGTFFQLAPELLDESHMTAVEMVDDPSRNYNRNMFYIPMNIFGDGPMAGSYLKLGFSFLEMFKLMANPIQFFEDNLFGMTRQGLNTLQYSLTHPEYVENSSLMEIWNAAQEQAYSQAYLNPGAPIQPPAEDDEETTQQKFLDNMKQFIPLWGTADALNKRRDVLERRTGLKGLPASMISTPYQAEVLDIFMGDQFTRTYFYRDNLGGVSHVEHVGLRPNDKKTEPTVYDPSKRSKITKTATHTIYELYDLGTGKRVYVGIYPVKKDGKFTNVDNNDGTMTSYLTDPITGEILWTQTTSQSIFDSAAGNVALRKDLETGRFVGAVNYAPTSWSTREYIDPDTGIVTQESILPDGSVRSTRRIVKTPQGDTIYYSYNANGILVDIKTYTKNEYDFEYLETDNPNETLVIGRDAFDNMKYRAHYVDKKIMIGGKEVTIRQYLENGSGENAWQYVYYDEATESRITYTLTKGKQSGNFAAKKIETYDASTNTILTSYFNSGGQIIKKETKDVNFNYLNYTPGSFESYTKQNFYDPETGVTLTNYLNKAGKVMFSRKIINTAEGKLYEYYDQYGNLTKKVLYPVTSGSTKLREELDFDIANNIKISKYFDDKNNLIYVRKIINDFNPDHLGTWYEYYDSDGHLTKRTFYSAFAAFESIDNRTATYLDSMDEAEQIAYTNQTYLQDLQTLSLNDPRGVPAGEEQYLEDFDTLDLRTAVIKNLSAQPGEFMNVKQKKASSVSYSTPYDTGFTFKPGAYNITGYTSRRSVFSGAKAPRMNEIFFQTPNFYKMLYTLNGDPRLINNVRQIAQRSQGRQLPLKLGWSYYHQQL
jgi:hypothetical protein